MLISLLFQSNFRSLNPAILQPLEIKQSHNIIDRRIHHFFHDWSKQNHDIKTSSPAKFRSFKPATSSILFRQMNQSGRQSPFQPFLSRFQATKLGVVDRISARSKSKGNGDEPRRKDFFSRVSWRNVERTSTRLPARGAVRSYLKAAARTALENEPPPRSVSVPRVPRRTGLFFPLAAATGPYIDPNDVTWLAVLRSPTWPTKGPQPGLCAPRALFLLPSFSRFS